MSIVDFVKKKISKIWYQIIEIFLYAPSRLMIVT